MERLSLSLSFIIYSDKFKEPLDLILKTFVLGIFLCIPAGLLNDLLIQSPDQSYFAGLTEESRRDFISTTQIIISN